MVDLRLELYFIKLKFTYHIIIIFDFNFIGLNLWIIVELFKM
jgi:hypothetical protein